MLGNLLRKHSFKKVGKTASKRQNTENMMGKIWRKLGNGRLFSMWFNQVETPPTGANGYWRYPLVSFKPHVTSPWKTTTFSRSIIELNGPSIPIIANLWFTGCFFSFYVYIYIQKLTRFWEGQFANCQDPTQEYHGRFRLAKKGSIHSHISSCSSQQQTSA